MIHLVLRAIITRHHGIRHRH